MKAPAKVLVVDVGGTGVKILATGQTERRRFPSGKTMTPPRWSRASRSSRRTGSTTSSRSGTRAWSATIARPSSRTTWRDGWVGFDFQAAFGCPVKIINDAAMQALGSYRGGTMLFLGLGTGLGTALVFDGTVVPLELAPSRDREEDVRGRSRHSRAQEAGPEEVAEARRGDHERFVSALILDEVVLGGGNAKKLTRLPMGCRMGDNANAFLGGFRLWEKARNEPSTETARRSPDVEVARGARARQLHQQPHPAIPRDAVGNVGKEHDNATRHDRTGTDGGEHGSPADRRRPRVRRLRQVAEGGRGTREGEGGRRVVAGGLRREALEAPRDLADGARRPSWTSRSRTSSRSSRRATS